LTPRGTRIESSEELLKMTQVGVGPEDTFAKSDPAHDLPMSDIATNDALIVNQSFINATEAKLDRRNAESILNIMRIVPQPREIRAQIRQKLFL